MDSKSRSYMAVAIVAGAIFALGLGVRQSQALFIGPINSSTGIGYASISFAFAVGQLMWGIAMPVAGALADRYSARIVMVIGALLVSLATMLTPLAHSTAALVVLIGLFAAIGAGAMGPGLIMSALARWVPEAKRSVATGIVNAGGSFGQFTVIPLAGLFIGLTGWQPAMVIMGVISLAAIPAILWVTQSAPVSAVAPAKAGAQSSLKDAVSTAFRDPSFLLLTAGFFTCGFHVAFIATHLPGVVALCGLPTAVSAWSLALIGLFNIFGSLWVGKFVTGRRMKTTLAGIYFARADHPRLLLLAEDHPDLPALRRRHRLQLSLHRPADHRPGHQVLRPALRRDPLRHGHALSPDRRLPRRLPGRQGLRSNRQLRLDVVGRYRALPLRRRRAPADSGA